MSAQMDRLEASVTAMTTVSGSAIALMNGLSAQVRDAAGDRARSIAVADEIDARAAELGTAVTDNTPAAVPA